MKKKLAFHLEPLLNNLLLKKGLGDRLKMTLVWVGILFCTAFLMKVEASEVSFQLPDNVFTQGKTW